MRWLAVILAFVCVALIVLGLGRLPLFQGWRALRLRERGAVRRAVRPHPRHTAPGCARLWRGPFFRGRIAREYENFSGTEYLFGGTSTRGRDVHVTFSLDAENGGGTLFLMSGDRMLEVLLDAQGRI